MMFRAIERKVFPFFKIIALSLLSKELFFCDKIYFSLSRTIKKRKTFDKKRKNMISAI